MIAGDDDLRCGLRGDQSAVCFIDLKADGNVAAGGNICISVVVQPVAGDYSCSFPVGGVGVDGSQRQGIVGVTIQSHLVVVPIAFILRVVNAGTLQIDTAPNAERTGGNDERASIYRNGTIGRDGVHTVAVNLLPVRVKSIYINGTAGIVAIHITDINGFACRQLCGIQTYIVFVYQINLRNCHICNENRDLILACFLRVLRIRNPCGCHSERNHISTGTCVVGNCDEPQIACYSSDSSCYHGCAQGCSIRAAIGRHPGAAVPVLHGGIEIVVRCPGAVCCVLILGIDPLSVIDSTTSTGHTAVGLLCAGGTVCDYLITMKLGPNRDIESPFHAVFSHLAVLVDPVYTGFNDIGLFTCGNCERVRTSTIPHTAITPNIPGGRSLSVNGYGLPDIVVLVFSGETDIEPDIFTHDGIAVFIGPIIKGWTDAESVHLRVVPRLSLPCLAQIHIQDRFFAANFLGIGNTDTVAVIDQLLERQSLGGRCGTGPQALTVRGEQFVGIVFVRIAGDEAETFRTVTGTAVAAATKQMLAVYCDLCNSDCMPNALQTDVIDGLYQQFIA